MSDSFMKELEEAVSEVYGPVALQNKQKHDDAEKRLIDILWKYRGKVTVTDMAIALGWSRQTIYNKWRDYGYNVRGA